MHLNLYYAAYLMWVAYFINFKRQFLVSSFFSGILQLPLTTRGPDFDALVLVLVLWLDLPDACNYKSVGVTACTWTAALDYNMGVHVSRCYVVASVRAPAPRPSWWLRTEGSKIWL